MVESDSPPSPGEVLPVDEVQTVNDEMETCEVPDEGSACDFISGEGSACDVFDGGALGTGFDAQPSPSDSWLAENVVEDDEELLMQAVEMTGVQSSHVEVTDGPPGAGVCDMSPPAGGGGFIPASRLIDISSVIGAATSKSTVSDTDHGLLEKMDVCEDSPTPTQPFIHDSAEHNVVVEFTTDKHEQNNILTEPEDFLCPSVVTSPCLDTNVRRDALKGKTLPQRGYAPSSGGVAMPSMAPLSGYSTSPDLLPASFLEERAETAFESSQDLFADMSLCQQQASGLVNLHREDSEGFDAPHLPQDTRSSSSKSTDVTDGVSPVNGLLSGNREEVGALLGGGDGGVEEDFDLMELSQSLTPSSDASHSLIDVWRSSAAFQDVFGRVAFTTQVWSCLISGDAVQLCLDPRAR